MAPVADCIMQVAPSDYMKVLLRYVDVENIPEYLGGGCEAAVVLVIVAVPQRLSWQLCAMWSAQVLPCILSSAFTEVTSSMVLLQARARAA